MDRASESERLAARRCPRRRNRLHCNSSGTKGRLIEPRPCHHPRRRPMILGMSVQAFTALHVAISLIGLLSGVIVVLGMLNDNRLPRWTALFVITTIATSATGFLFHSTSFGPPQVVGVISLIVLLGTVGALYVYHLSGRWRSVYVVTAVLALYLERLRGRRAGVSEDSCAACARTDGLRAALPRGASGSPGAVRADRNSRREEISPLADRAGTRPADFFVKASTLRSSCLPLGRLDSGRREAA